MKSLILATISLLFVSGCSSAPIQQNNSGPANSIDYRFAVKTPNSTPVNTAIYNKMIAAQGLDYHCRSGRCDKLPKLLSGYAPVYPPELMAAGITGYATIVFTIDELGSVVDPRVESASRSEFSDASIRAVQTWRFKPATLNGQAVRQTSRQQFPFHLR